MIAERDMYCHTYGSRNVTVKLDTDQIRAAGDAQHPVLQVQPQFLVRTATGTQFARQDLLVSYSATLCPEGKNYPWSQTGLQPFTTGLLYLPITHVHIETITKLAHTHPEGDVYLNFGFSLIAASQLNPDRAVEQLPPWLTHSVDPFQVTIPAPRWLTFLKTWGYPETRLLPVSMTLPEALATANPIADKAWGVVTNALTTATAEWQSGSWLKAGQELRRATQFALLAWASIWGEDGPFLKENMADAFKFFDKALPKVDPTRGEWFRGTTEADAYRVCTRFHMLRQLYTLSHSIHHLGERPVYTEGDIDYLLNSVVSYCRALPAFWAEYPKPLQQGIATHAQQL